jgi:hypothetical protein
MKKATFKKIIWANVILAILVVTKMVFYPYSLAPAEFSKAMILYEELQPLADTFVVIMILLILIGYFVSLFLLYKFNDYGRQLYLVVNFLTLFLFFSQGYVVFDSLDYFLDAISSILIGFIIAIIYFSNLSKEFKKK